MARRRSAGRLLVVGRNAFLARAFLEACDEPPIAVGHDAIDHPDLLDNVDRIVGFMRHPLLRSADYRPERMDPDLRLAERIADRAIHYVMLSSCRVYAPSARPLAESDPTGPRDPYGEHKLWLERELQARLGPHLTTLRLGNMFGDEREAGRRTFFALMLDGLAREGRIRFNMSPFVKRDFLPAASFARLLARIVTAPPGGILNVGSGIPLATGRAALWLIEGYGRGELVIESSEEKDAFVLDIDRLRSLYGQPCTYQELRTSRLNLGRRLASESIKR